MKYYAAVPGRNAYKSFVLLVCCFLASFAVAQKRSAVESMSWKGYDLRFRDSAQCFRILETAAVLAKEQVSKKDEAINYALTALAYRRFSDLDRFRRYSEMSYETASITRDHRALAYANMVMGYLNTYIDNSTEGVALNYFLTAYRLFDRLKEYGVCARILSDVSYLFSPHDMVKCRKYAYEALRYAKLSAVPDNILHARLAVGSYLLELSNADHKYGQQAISYYEETIRIAEDHESQITIKSNIAIAYLNLATLEINRLDSVPENVFFYHIQKATDISRKYKMKSIYRNLMGLQGEYYQKKGRYDDAEEFYNKGLVEAAKLPYKDNDLMSEFYRSLKNLSVKRGDFKSYYHYDTLFIPYFKAEYNDKAQKMIQYADVKFETEKKKNQILQLKKENQLQKKNTLLGFAIAGILLIVLILLYLSFYYRRQYFRKTEDHLRQAQTNSELKLKLLEKESLESLTEKLSLERRLLQSQMDPHFIFNALGNIQGMILQNDQNNAVSYLGKFARLTRQVLEHSRHEFITLEEEILTLKDYIELQRVRFNDAFDYDIHCEKDVEVHSLIPSMLIQPSIENAIEHGLKPVISERQGLLSISFSQDNQKHIIICAVTDNGIGLAESKRRKNRDSHVSLANTITHERLAVMSLENPHTGFSIRENAEGGCTATIIIPIFS